MSFLVARTWFAAMAARISFYGCTVGVDPGEIAVVVGPNGAGKSTAMKAMFGMLDLKEGQVLLEGEDITGLKPQGGFFAAWVSCPRTTMSLPA